MMDIKRLMYILNQVSNVLMLLLLLGKFIFLIFPWNLVCLFCYCFNGYNIDFNIFTKE